MWCHIIIEICPQLLIVWNSFAVIFPVNYHIIDYFVAHFRQFILKTSLEIATDYSRNNSMKQHECSCSSSCFPCVRGEAGLLVTG